MRLGHRIGPRSVWEGMGGQARLDALATACMGFFENAARAIGAERGGLAGAPELLDARLNVGDGAGEAIGGRLVARRAPGGLEGHVLSSNRLRHGAASR
jgi:hypothetical protein